MKDSVIMDGIMPNIGTGWSNLTWPENEVNLNIANLRIHCMSVSTTRERIWQIAVGDSVGMSEWLVVSQQMICEFGAVTLDPDPMHLDADWAAKNGPFGGAIAYGFLTISLLTTLFNSAVGDPTARERHSEGSYLNYGMERVRLVTPVPAGASVRGHFSIAERRQDAQGRWITVINFSVEIKGHDRPALFGQWLFMWIPPLT
jgi:acyl dehydratase